jgi:predicted RNase H-like HicB family nuclease
MKKNIVEISFTGNNFGAWVPELLGCVSVGDTPEDIKQNIQEAIEFHLEGMRQDNDPIPPSFEGNYKLVYKFDTESLLQYYKGIFSAPAFERMTGINQKQIHHYSSGLKKPRIKQKEKIVNALHKLGEELLAVEL